MPNFAGRVTFLFLAFTLCLALGACGKRGTYIYPPSEDKDDTFPNIYPDPATDPGYVAKPHQPATKP
jgi:predicted small lipoprotein YifL